MVKDRRNAFPLRSQEQEKDIYSYRYYSTLEFLAVKLGSKKRNKGHPDWKEKNKTMSKEDMIIYRKF